MNKNKLPMLVLLCLTLGLAPFTPEPHIWGKLKWIAGGGKGMQMMDWLDTLFHGFPWILLLAYSLQVLMKNLKERSKK